MVQFSQRSGVEVVALRASANFDYLLGEFGMAAGNNGDSESRRSNSFSNEHSILHVDYLVGLLLGFWSCTSGSSMFSSWSGQHRTTQIDNKSGFGIVFSNYWVSCFRVLLFS